MQTSRSPTSNASDLPEPASLDTAIAQIESRLGPGVLYPLSYAVPEQLIAGHVPDKQRWIAERAERTNIGQTNTTRGYQFGPGEQAGYYQHYRESLAARSPRKGGWDCMRHLEIALNGSLPLMPDLPHCPAYTMAHYPKPLLLQVLDRYGHLLDPCPDDNAPVAVDTDYDVLVGKLLQWTREQQSTVALARYFLKTMNAEDARSVLFLSGASKPHYSGDMLMHGLRTLLGDGLVDARKLWWLYDSASPRRVGKLYGNGFTYARHLPDIPVDRSRLRARIRKQTFDLIIFGCIELGTPLTRLVKKHYPRQRVALIDGGDFPRCPCDPLRPRPTSRPWWHRWATPDHRLYDLGVVFKREIDSETLDYLQQHPPLTPA